MVLWVTEALPLPVTALAGVVACVMAGVAPAKEVFLPFADPLIFLFIGSFMLAEAIRVHGLDRRLAFSVLGLPAVGERPGRILAAVALVRYEFPGKEWVNTILIAPALVPETVLGVGLLLLMRFAHQPRTMWLLVLGHIMLALPYVVLVVQARLIGVKRVYEEAAMSLGANRLQTFREITLPLIMPAIVASLLLVFTISFDNVTASMFWRPSGVETMPTEILSMLKISISPEINALGTLMIVVTVGLPLLGGGLARYLARSAR